MQARGGDASYIWSGLWKAKEELCKGYHWVLGDGKEINIFKDPWLRGKPNFCIEDHHLNSVRNNKVCNYFRPNTKEWDKLKLDKRSLLLILTKFFRQRYLRDNKLID